jgi:hypothetical protein
VWSASCFTQAGIWLGLFNSVGHWSKTWIKEFPVHRKRNKILQTYSTTFTGYVKNVSTFSYLAYCHYAKQACGRRLK